MLQPELYKVCVGCVCVSHKFWEEKDQRICDICDSSGDGTGTELGNAGSPHPDLELLILVGFLDLAPSSLSLFFLFQRQQ